MPHPKAHLLALHFGLLGIVHVFCFLFFILCQLCLLLLLGKLKHLYEEAGHFNIETSWKARTLLPSIGCNIEIKNQ